MHGLYVALARHQGSVPAPAGQTLRLADWYVRFKDGEPDTVANETHHLVRFDTQGQVDWATTPAAHPHRPETARMPEDEYLEMIAPTWRVPDVTADW